MSDDEKTTIFGYGISKKDLFNLFEPLAENCLVAWTDLLGFGSSLDDMGWEFSSIDREDQKVSLWRLDKMYKYAHDIAGMKSTTFALNDGFAHNIDIDSNTMTDTFWGYLIAIIKYHDSMNKEDTIRGFPGLRTVVAYGQRLIDAHFIPKLSMKRKQPSIGRPRVRVINRPFPKRVAVYTPSEFQMNLAFSKAYLLDDLGKREGLEGPNIFLDESVVKLLSDENGAGSLRNIQGMTVVKEFKENLLHLSLVHDQKTISEIVLKIINSELRTRWGITTVYQVIRARRDYIFGDFEYICS